MSVALRSGVGSRMGLPPAPPEPPRREGPRGVRLVWLELGDVRGALSSPAPKNRGN